MTSRCHQLAYIPNSAPKKNLLLRLSTGLDDYDRVIPRGLSTGLDDYDSMTVLPASLVPSCRIMKRYSFPGTGIVVPEQESKESRILIVDGISISGFFFKTAKTETLARAAERNGGDPR